MTLFCTSRPAIDERPSTTQIQFSSHILTQGRRFQPKPFSILTSRIICTGYTSCIMKVADSDVLILLPAARAL